MVDFLGKCSVASLIFCLFLGCEYDPNFEMSWSRSITGLNNSWEGDPHEHCRKDHNGNKKYRLYVDPYTNEEYCIPEGFNNFNKLHLYRIKND